MNYIEYIWLSNLDISNQNKWKLLHLLDGIQNLYQCKLDDLIALRIQEEIAYKILNKITKEKALRDYEYMMRNQIEIISAEAEEYPTDFHFLRDIPVCFYIKGNKKILNQEGVGIVGSRIALRESLEIAKLVAKACAFHEINVISGLAKGIDRNAHLGCLEANSAR